MDRTTPHERAEKLLASAYPEMLKCIAEALMKECNIKREFHFNISEAGECKLFIGSGFTITL